MAEKIKKYASLKDIPPREYMYFPKGQLEMGRPGKFSRLEVLQLVLAVIVLTVAFAFPLSKTSVLNYFLYDSFNFESIILFLPLSLLGICTAFFVHELSHKFMAQRFGLWSEFRMFPKGLVFSLLLAMFSGFVFAAPGAVIFRGEARHFEMGRIAAAGSLANIIIAVITYPLYIYVFFETVDIARIIGFICLVNALLATFNLLPFRPLDGAEVIRWNGIVWGCMFSLAFVVTVLIVPRVMLFL